MLNMADVECFKCTIWDNKYLSEKVRNQIIQTWKGTADEKARLYGEFVRKTGLLYPTFTRNIHVQPYNKEFIEKQFPVIRIIDPHPQIPIHCAWLAINPNGECAIVNELVCPENATIPRCAALIKAKESGMNLRFGVIDTSANTKQQQANGAPSKTTKQLLAAEGIVCRGAKKGWDAGHHIVEMALQGVEIVDRATGEKTTYHKFHVYDNCIEVIYEFGHCVWAEASNDEVDEPQRQVKKRDHMMDIVRYGLMEVANLFKTNKQTNAPKCFFGGNQGWRN